MKTMCPPGYHHNAFVETHALGHMIYGVQLIMNYKNYKETKPSYQVLRYSEFPVHNELTLCVQWNSIFFQEVRTRCSGPTLH